ncbi:MAG: hypothetical protein JNM89_13840 [Hyphomicrobiaceae bacterium]|nr:hypothetical protein [Hyphomicrobiaceae bacterium]
MFGGLFKTTSLAALIAAGMAFGGASAQAADLGGDCCADLEERVAELEATTARKGNRKVTLTVSGQVNELVYWWDDGVESNVYQGTSGFSSTRFRFKGDAKINSDWSAGYYLEIEAVSAQVSGNTATDDDPTTGLTIRQSNWYLKSKTLGTITVGQQSHATDDIVLFSIAGIAPFAGANLNAAPGAGLTFRGSTLEVNDVFSFLDSDRANLVRYDSPTIGGFMVSASWGEDDMWDVALRYAGEFNGIKIAGGIGYHVERDQTGDAGYNLPAELYGFDRPDFEEIRGSISVMHTPTGLFGEFAAVSREFDLAGYGDFFYWSVRAGIQQKWTPLGKTTLFGEYAESDTTAAAGVFGNFNANNVFAAANISSVEGTSYGVGLVQNIDAAAMELYLGYRHFEADLLNNAGAAIPTQDIDTVYSGARIQF